MKKTALVAAVCAASLAALTLAGCGNTATSSSTETKSEATAEVTTDDSAAAPGDEAGFQEISIFEDEELGGFIHMNAVYFQPVTMTGGYDDISDVNLHLEADISALENDLGFGTGDWIPYLTVSYKVEDESGATVAEGTFMPMSASDGPHYGQNIYLEKAGTYQLTISVSPQEDVYLIHTDSETGPGNGGHSFDDYFKDGALSVTKEWKYTPVEY